MRYLAAAVLALALCACKPTEEEVQHVHQALPDGCALHNLGSYGDISNLVVVTCDGRQTQSSNWYWTTQCGKARCGHTAASVWVRHGQG